MSQPDKQPDTRHSDADGMTEQRSPGSIPDRLQNLGGAARGISRRRLLQTMGAAGVGLGLAAGRSAPAVASAVEITYWYWADNPGIALFFRDAIDGFNASQNQVRVTGEAQPNTAAAREKIIATAAAGSGGPDATYGNTAQQQEYFDAGLIVSLEDFLADMDDADDIIPEVLDSHRIREDQPLSYMPWGIAAEMQYYRRDQYEEAGLSPPDTIEQLLANAQDLNDPPNRYGYGLRGADQFGFTWQFITHLMNLGIVIVDEDGNTGLDSPEGIAAAEKVLAPFWEGYAQPSALEDRFPQMTALFQTGRVSHWGASTNHSAFLKGEVNQYADVTAAVMQPKGEGHERKVTMATTGNMILASSQEPEAAFEWIKWLMAPEQQAAFGQAAAFTPTRRSVIDKEEFFQEDPYHLLTLESAPYYALYPYWHKNWPEFNITTGVQQWQLALQRQIDAEELMTNLAAVMRDV